MISIYDKTTAATALAQNLPADMRDLIEGHLATAKENGLSELTHIAVIEEGDSEATMIEELGFSPLHNPLTGERFGDPGFSPHWDWLEIHPAWHEMLYCVGDSGFAFVLYVAKNQSLVAQMCSESANNPAL
jgi:hypothetical protein